MTQMMQMASHFVRRWSKVLGHWEKEIRMQQTCLRTLHSVKKTAAEPAKTVSTLVRVDQSERTISISPVSRLLKWPQISPQLHHQQTAGLATSAAIKGSSTPGPKLGFSSLVLLAPCGLTLFLGLWQLQRREQKIAMLAERQEKLAAPPVSLKELLAARSQSDDSAGSNPSELEFRRVELTGSFDTSKSMFVGPRVKSAPGGMTEKGFHVITPLVPEDKRAPPVLVNRGWVPNDWAESATSGEKITVCGVVRGSDQPSQFVPPNVPEAGEWFFIDAPRMAKECALGDNILVIEATSDVSTRPGSRRDAQYPEPRDPFELARFRIMPQDHLNYAMTWLTLFAAVSTMAYMRLFGRSSRQKQIVLEYKDRP